MKGNGQAIATAVGEPQTALVPVERGMTHALVPRDFAELWKLSETLAKSTIIPKDFRGSPANVFVAVSFGLELGMYPSAALRSVYVIGGKPALYADAIVARVLSSSVCRYFYQAELTNERCTYITHRVGVPEPQRYTFTIDEARTAKLLGNDNWTKWPKRMLKARAAAFLARDVYPDLLAGVYAVEELQDVIDVEPVEVYSPPPAPEPMHPSMADVRMPSSKPDDDAPEIKSSGPSEAERELAAIVEHIEAAEDANALRALIPRIKALPPEFMDAVRGTYDKRSKELAG